MKHRITVIGSGNWGTAIASHIASNILSKPDFDDTVFMYTYEEMIDGKKLTNIINTEHENVKYLPGVSIPKNVIAVADLKISIEDSNILIFVVPHQFLKNIVNQIKEYIKKDCFAISLIKGIFYEDGELVMISDYISKELNIKCDILMGANIANQVGQKCISEGTLSFTSKRSKRIFMEIFNSYTYRVACVDDLYGVELMGVLKNIVSIAYGIAVGLKFKENTCVAILRNGLNEMKKFGRLFFDIKESTLFESSGIADLMVSVLCGRNFKCGVDIAGCCSIDDVECDMKGQKLQGTLTSKEIFTFLQKRNKVEEFPLFCMVYKICYEKELCDAILETIPYRDEDGNNIKQ